MITTYNGKPIEVMDIWGNTYSCCFAGKDALDKVAVIEGRTLYTDLLHRHYYFLTDSRYGDDFFL